MLADWLLERGRRATTGEEYVRLFVVMIEGRK